MAEVNPQQKALALSAGKRIYFIWMIILLVIFSSCQSDDGELLHFETYDPLSNSELTSVMTIDSVSDLHLRQENSSAGKVKRCLKYVKRFSRPLRKLRTFLSRDLVSKETLALKLSELSSAHCAGVAERKTSVLINDYMTRNTQSIGLIIPNSGDNHEYSASLLEGFQAAVRELNPDPTIRLFIRDSRGTPEGASGALSELLLIDETMLIIGGLVPEVAGVITHYSSRLGFPAFILNRDEQLIEKHPYSFQIYPNQKDQIRSLLELSKKKGLVKIGLLKADGLLSDKFTRDLEDEIQKAGLSLVQVVSYKSGDYASMNHAVSEITQTSPRHRPEEFQRMMRDAQEKAESEGRVFNPDTVILPPLFKVDTVFLPDHFKSVRYFVKLFKYHGVQKFPLIGLQTWRSAELIQPWEKFLEGSFFSDFIGYYPDVLKRIEPEYKGHPLFVAPATAAHVDLKLIGYRAALMAFNLVKNPFVKKNQMVKKLLTMTESHDLFSIKSFYRNRQSRWPAYLFGIDHKRISLLTEPGPGGSLIK